VLYSSFRALSTLTATQRDQGLAAAALALAFAGWVDARFRLPEPDLPQYQGIDPETAAMAVRTEWNSGERPIPNMIHLLEAHGVRVFSLAEECAELDAFSFWHAGIPYAFLNTMKSAERSRMDAAHELGHLVLHWKIGVRGRETEREAEQFASAFLMPRGSILAEAPRRGTLTEIIRAKKRWNVSAASLTYRMHRLGLLSDWQYRSLFVEIARNGYRTEEPNGSQHEKSQLLTKVFQTLRHEGITETQIAQDLDIETAELKGLIFGLFRPALRLV
jgi:Zn-dependent peptidase ImmA (M78 family)